MQTLRIRQNTLLQSGHFQIGMTIHAKDMAPLEARAEIKLALSEEDQRDLRWSLEDYRQHRLKPAPKIAKCIEGRLEVIGCDLFRSVFMTNDACRDLWTVPRDSLNKTHVEIAADVNDAGTIPWELLENNRTRVAFAVGAKAFVRTWGQTARRLHLPKRNIGAIRNLLVICRPIGADGVPFRSVATRLIKGLGTENCDSIQLDILRPPTHARLTELLQLAFDEGKAYHVVHFDGHDCYGETDEVEFREGDRNVFNRTRAGMHGYLCFENPELEDNKELSDCPSLGKLLAETETPVLVLNACRSAHTEGVDEPEESTEHDVHGINHSAKCGSIG